MADTEKDQRTTTEDREPEGHGPGRPAGDLLGQVSAASAGVESRGSRQDTRRSEALSLRLAGLTYDQIGDRLGITSEAARGMIQRTLGNAVNRNVDSERAVENARLDRAQAAIWSQVLQGDMKAINTFLSISKHRAAINGLLAPMKVDMSVSIRQEMVQALDELENLVLGTSEVVSEEALHDGQYEQRPAGADRGGVGRAGGAPAITRGVRNIAG